MRYNQIKWFSHRFTKCKHLPTPPLPKKRPDFVEEDGGGGFWIWEAVGARLCRIEYVRCMMGNCLVDRWMSICEMASSSIKTEEVSKDEKTSVRWGIVYCWFVFSNERVGTVKGYGGGPVGWRIISAQKDRRRLSVWDSKPMEVSACVSRLLCETDGCCDAVYLLQISAQIYRVWPYHVQWWIG